MTKVIITKGLPASGKTTWAKEQQQKEPNTVLVNKDDLRAMLHQGVWSRGREEYVLDVRDYIIVSSVLSGHDVIVHDTNLPPKHEARIRELVELHNHGVHIGGKVEQVEVEIKDFTDVPLEECIKRDQKRANYVGEQVIRRMYNQFLRQTPPTIDYVANLPEAIICDLDGTLALFGDANPYERDFLQDKVNESVENIISAYSAACDDGWGDVKLILVSGRKDKFRDQTEEWLRQNRISYDALYMRKTAPEGQQEPKDVVVKREIYEEHIKGKYNVRFVLDDRNQVVELWRSLGLTCLQVAEGDF